MARMILAQLRHRPGRAVALLVGVLFATTGFTVLTGSTATSRLVVQGTVAGNARGAYDVLVRPTGARTELEQQRGLVRANFLAGRYGGIATAQWQAVAAVPGVEVAAPIAMVGYGTTLATVVVDVTDAVDPALESQLIRVWPTWIADRGLTVAPDDSPSVVYVTRNPLRHWTPTGSGESDRYDDGRERRPGGCGVAGDHPTYELLPDGTERPLCLDGLTSIGRDTPPSRSVNNAVQVTAGRTVLFGPGQPRLTVPVVVPMPLLVAAIDPAAEAALTGLDRAVTSGRYLDPGETDLATGPGLASRAPAVFSSESYVDESLVTRTERVTGPDILRPTFEANRDRVRGLPAVATLPAQTHPLRDVYRDFLRPFPTGYPARVQLTGVIQVGEVRYDVGPDGTLRPSPERPAAQTWEPHTGLGYPPWLANDSAQRRATIQPLHSSGMAALAESVGIFDPTRLNRAGPLSTPLDTYVTSTATGADERTTGLLGGQPLAPNSNPGGYLAASPTVLLPLSALGSGDRISGVRVRVAGVTGFDPLSRERVRRVAEDIAAATGLDVEVMLGASGAPQTIRLPAGNFGRPELTLAELWSRKGVAATVVEAIDHKSVVLFGLILVVCVLFLANAAAAAVRDRRRELAILACVGWPRRRLGALILGEVALIGLTAGVIGAGLSPPLGDLVGIDVPIGRSWFAVPVALGLCLVAAAVPAWRASGSRPLAAVHRAAAPVGRRGRPRRRVAGLAVANLRRAPGRTLLGALAVAVGTGGLTMVASVLGAFHGTITGTVLGDAITVRVRGVDVVAVVATLLVAAVAVADVLYLNVRDRAAEFAALRALGWSDGALARLVVYEGAGIGLVGSLPGAGLGLAAAAGLVGQVPESLMWTAGLTAAAGVVLAALSAAVPALLQRRLPLSVLLAEE